MYYIFSFSSRNGAMRFCDAANAFGIAARLVNTPRLTGSGCGLSVKCADYESCRGILMRGQHQSLRAVYSFDGAEYKIIYSTPN